VRARPLGVQRALQCIEAADEFERSLLPRCAEITIVNTVR
jgi:hypothetical protein